MKIAKMQKSKLKIHPSSFLVFAQLHFSPGNLHRELTARLSDGP
jgi:hypothetical protein